MFSNFTTLRSTWVNDAVTAFGTVAYLKYNKLCILRLTMLQDFALCS